MKYSSYILIVFIGFVGCIEPYSLKNITYTNLLVVDGNISNVDKPQQVKLSRTSPLNEKVFIPETEATVKVETESKGSISFSEVKPGIYESASFAGAVGEKYTLSITTKNGHVYKSKPVVLKNVPSIGNIYAEFITAPSRGIKIYVDTEDPLNNTHYYRWDYIETYEIQTPFPSDYEVLPGATEPTWRYDRVDRCWASDTLRDVLIKSTHAQNQDKVIAFPLRFIPEYSYIFRIKYSLLVQQYALSEEAYNYWETIRIFNETQGTLADVQPGAISSNVVNVSDPSETVLGYFDASAISEKRVFFDYRDFLSAGYDRPTYLSGCNDIKPILLSPSQVVDYMNAHNKTMAIWDILGAFPPIFYEAMPISCCDCTSLGTNIKPSYWPR